MFKNKDGFTLIEVLLALSILSIVCVIFLNVIIDSYKIWIKEDKYMAKNQMGELALQTIINQLRFAKDISIVQSKDEIEFRCYYRNEDMVWLKYGLYLVDDIKVLGLKKANYGESSINYSNYMPLINNVTELKFINLGSNNSIYKVKLTVADNRGNSRDYINRVVTVQN